MTTYSIRWWRVAGGRDLQQCMGLTDRDLVRRLIGAIETSGPVVIESVTRETASSQETKVSYVPAIDPNNCLHSNQRRGEAGPPWCNDCGATLNRGESL